MKYFEIYMLISIYIYGKFIDDKLPEKQIRRLKTVCTREISTPAATAAVARIQNAIWFKMCTRNFSTIY